MKTFSEVDSCLGLIRHIQQLGHTIEPQFLTTRTESTGKHPLQHTYLFQRLGSFLDFNTRDWLKKLHDNAYQPKWYAVSKPYESPIVTFESTVLAASQSEALGYVLENMEEFRVIPTAFKTSENGGITIIGDESDIAHI